MLDALRHRSLAAATAMRSCFQDANLLGSGIEEEFSYSEFRSQNESVGDSEPPLIEDH